MSAQISAYFEANVGIFKYFAILAVIFYAPNIALLFRGGHKTLAIVYIFLALSVILLAIYVQKTLKTKVATNIFVLIAMITLLPWQITGGIANTGIMWLFSFIVFATFLSGVLYGSLWIALTYLISVILFVLQLMGVLPLPYTVPFMLNFYFVSIIVYLLIVVFALVRNDLEKQLSIQKLSIEESQKAAKIGNWEWDIKKDEIVWSDLLKEMFSAGDSEQKFGFSKYLEFIYEEDRDKVNNAVQDALETGSPFSFEHRVKKANGEILWVHGEGRVDLEKQVMHGTAQDITERKKAELALIMQNEQLKRAEKLMVGREQKMIELKDRIKQLESKEQK